MPSRVPSSRILRCWQPLRYAHQAATKPAASPGTNALPKQEAKLTTLPNGMLVVSMENYAPIAKVSVSFKAGCRHENPANMGVTHALRNCAGLGTKDCSMLGITRSIQQIGGSLTTAATREHISYNVEANRDSLDTALRFLLQVTTKQVFKPWEVNDSSPRLKVDLASLKTQPHALVLEHLHKAAYRDGLGNSLYTPSFMLGEHEPEMLQDFVKNHFTTNRASVVGLGVSHKALVTYANSLHVENGSGPADNPSKYGGGEIRVDTGDTLTYVAVATEGASLKNPKDVLSLAVLQQILGTVPNVKWSNGLAANKLAQIAAKSTEKPFAISGLNINHSDSGLFGFYVVADHGDMGRILKGVLGHYSSITKSGVTDTDVQKAKSRLKAALAFAQESDSQVVDEMVSQSLVNGHLTSLAESYSTIDALTSADITALAKKVINGKPSMSAVGNLSETPYLDQLL